MIIELKNIEFSSRPDGDVEVRFSDKIPFILKENNSDFILVFNDKIRTEYSEAYYYLKLEYQDSVLNRPYYEFLIARRFIKCNFSAYDHQNDIDEKGDFHFEYGHCPLFGECKYWRKICHPKRTIKISTAEMRVLKLYADGFTDMQVAVKLHLSIFTIETHRKNMLKKLGISNKAALVTYYHKLNFK